MDMKQTYSTAQVAKEIGVSKKTLLRWLYAGKIPEPKKQTFGGVESRVWTDSDLSRAKEYRACHFGKRA
jgi:predicted site-specific integrase-resolvase